jgi:hypothetical protein
MSDLSSIGLSRSIQDKSSLSAELSTPRRADIPLPRCVKCSSPASKHRAFLFRGTRILFGGTRTRIMDSPPRIPRVLLKGLSGQRRTVGLEADVYSLGVILADLLNGTNDEEITRPEVRHAPADLRKSL